MEKKMPKGVNEYSRVQHHAQGVDMDEYTMKNRVSKRLLEKNQETNELENASVSDAEKQRREEASAGAVVKPNSKEKDEAETLNENGEEDAKEGNESLVVETSAQEVDVEEEKGVAEEKCKENNEGKEEDEGKRDTTPVPPSGEDLRFAVSEIVREVDLDMTTNNDIIKQLEGRFCIDLSDRKVQIRPMINDEANKVFKERHEGKRDTTPVPPSDEDLRFAVSGIVREADLDTITNNDIIKQLEGRFGIDLSDRKVQIRLMINDEANKVLKERNGSDHAEEDQNMAVDQ